MIGSTVQKYRIVRELGSGAMGAVYEAVDTLTERPVAMKVLRAELAKQPELIERFRSEAITLARLNHPNIAILYDFFLAQGDYYMAMEFVRGKSLELFIRQENRLASNLAASIMRQTLEGLAHAHSMGVLHRDIKPANILITDDLRVKVTDFGIARVLGSSRMTRHGRIIGTLEYIAPERIRGDESDPRSDLYAAGVVLCEMLSGKLPFTGDTDFALIKAHLEQDPPPLADVLGAGSPAAWDAIIHRAMAKAVDQRFQTPDEFSQALPENGVALRPSGQIAAPLPSAAVRRAPTRPPGAPVATPVLAAHEKRSPLMMVLLAATAVMVVLLVLTIVLRIRGSSAARVDPAPAPSSHTITPVSDPGTSAIPQQNDVPKAGGQGLVIPADAFSTAGSKAKGTASSSSVNAADQRRQAALRALDGKGTADKNAKHSAALKALDH